MVTIVAKCANSKPLEQKAIGPSKESHARGQSPNTVCKRSYAQGDQKLQQEEQEHGFEQESDFLEEEEGMDGSNK